MANVKPFLCVRPAKDKAARVAALPYDVYSEEEARKETEREPLTFLRIDRAETQFPAGTSAGDPQVYQKAAALLNGAIADGTFVEDKEPCFYLYELTWEGRSQTGVAGCVSVDDYLKGTVRRHENTRTEKEEDRVSHVRECQAQTGPIFMACDTCPPLREAMGRIKEEEEALYDFTSPDGVRHRVWRAGGEARTKELQAILRGIPALYIADGHHRAASAVRVAESLRAEHPDYTGEEEYNYFLSVIFGREDLQILPYNRVVRDLNGLTPGEFLCRLEEKFQITGCGALQVSPQQKGELGLYLAGSWYHLRVREELRSSDPVDGLDVSYLQQEVLTPILGIGDPRTDQRIDFVGGIRGLDELERRCQNDMAAAFSLYATSMEELFTVADAGRMMPPKSTWFEPKLRSGLFIHRI